ncbi:unnamed protein product [Closterium sp. NIES-54]
MHTPDCTRPQLTSILLGDMGDCHATKHRQHVHRRLPPKPPLQRHPRFITNLTRNPALPTMASLCLTLQHRKPHTQHRCFSRLEDAWRTEFGDEAERPRWAELLRSGVDIFDLDYDAILAAMYALSVRSEGDSYLCVPPDPGIEAAALGASESTWSLPPLSPSPASPCLHCIEGRQRVAPYSSSFPLTNAPLHTLHMDVSGPAHVSGQGRERYFLLVVDDYMPYTTVFPLRSKGEVPDVLIPWICAVRLQLHERFRQDLPVLRLHCDRGGEFSSDLLRDFCHGEGILQSFMLPASPQQNGIAERCIGLVMEVAHTSMIHAVAPHFLWPFAVRYAAHQLNLLLCVSLPETLPILRWTGKVGDASLFRFYHPTSRRVLPSQDVTFDESVPFYCLFPYRSAPLPPPPLFHAPGPPLVDPLPLQGHAPSGVSQVDPLPSTVPVEVTVDLGAAIGLPSGGAEPAGTEPGGAESECAGFGGAEPGGAEPGGAEPTGAEPGSAESEGAETGGA